MFSQTWKKYLPVISLLIRKSAQGEQTITLNNTDFDRAAGGRKIKYSFAHLQLNKGRINTEVKHTPFAKEFSVILQEDENVQKLLSGLYLEFSLNNQLQLKIKNTAVEETVEATAAPAQEISSEAIAVEDTQDGEIETEDTEAGTKEILTTKE
jgi:hypothetical protein